MVSLKCLDGFGVSAVLNGGRVAGKMVEYVDVTLSIKKLAPNNGRLSINHIKQAFGGLIKSRPDLKDATFNSLSR